MITSFRTLTKLVFATLYNATPANLKINHIGEIRQVVVEAIVCCKVIQHVVRIYMRIYVIQKCQLLHKVQLKYRGRFIAPNIMFCKILHGFDIF